MGNNPESKRIKGELNGFMGDLKSRTWYRTFKPATSWVTWETETYNTLDDLLRAARQHGLEYESILEGYCPYPGPFFHETKRHCRKVGCTLWRGPAMLTAEWMKTWREEWGCVTLEKPKERWFSLYPAECKAQDLRLQRLPELEKLNEKKLYRTV